MRKALSRSRFAIAVAALSLVPGSLSSQAPINSPAARGADPAISGLADEMTPDQQNVANYARWLAEMMAMGYDWEYGPGSVDQDCWTSNFTKVDQLLVCAFYKWASGLFLSSFTPATLGGGPSGVVVSPSQGTIYSSNSITNNVSGFGVNLVTGAMTALSGSPYVAGANPNGIAITPSGRFVYVSQGISNAGVAAYAVAAGTGKLSSVGTYPIPDSSLFTGPIVATNQFVFVVQEGGAGAGVDAYSIDPVTGALALVTGSPFVGSPVSSLAVSRDGNFLFVPLHGLTTFSINAASGALSPSANWPQASSPYRLVAIHPQLPVVYGATDDATGGGAGNTVQAFRFESSAGNLTPVGAAVALSPCTPASMVASPGGNSLLVGSVSTCPGEQVAAYQLDFELGDVEPPGALESTPYPSTVLSIAPGPFSILGKGVAFSFPLRVFGGAPPFTFVVADGALPPGLKLAATTGAISGTPTQIGQFGFRVHVADAAGTTTDAVYSMQVVTPVAAPSTPIHFSASANSPTSVILTWQSQTAADGIAELALDGVNFVPVAASASTFPALQLNGLSPATTYSFRVHNMNTGGVSAATAPVSTTTFPAPAFSCSDSPLGQCLLDGRFKLEAMYQAAGGQAGQAHVASITGDTAYLWFFDPGNVEAVVKIVDGCADGGHYWVFAGGLTNVHVILHVTDVMTQAERYYETELGPAFAPLQDTAAFATCSGTSGLATQARRRAPRPIPSRPQEPEPAGGCTVSGTNLCLNNQRFLVSASFSSAAASGLAQAVALTADTGYLWFFDAANVEAVVKVVNGCGVNGHYWVFAGGLTNVNTTVTVVDTTTGARRTYSNPADTPFQPIQDTTAFGGCP